MAKLTRPAKNSTKPTAKGAGKPTAKGAAAAPQIKTVEPKFAIGDHVLFKGYTVPKTPEGGTPQPAKEGMFKPDQRLVIVDYESVIAEGDTKNTNMYACTPWVEGRDMLAEYTANPDSVSGEQVIESELKKAPPIEEPVEVTDTPEVAQLIQTRGNDLRALAQEMIGSTQQTYFNVGGVLAHLYYDKSYQNYEPANQKGRYTDLKDGWNNFCNDAFDFSGAKGRDLIRIYMIFSKLDGISAETFAEVGYAKMVRMAGFVTQENVQDIIQKAKETRIADLVSWMKTTYVTETGAQAGSGKSATRAVRKKVAIQFTLFEDQAEGVQMVIKRGMAANGMTDLSQFLELVIMQWATDHLSDKDNKAAAAAIKAKQKELKDKGIEVPAPAAAAPAAKANGAKPVAAPVGLKKPAAGLKRPVAPAAATA